MPSIYIYITLLEEEMVGLDALHVKPPFFYYLTPGASDYLRPAADRSQFLRARGTEYGAVDTQPYSLTKLGKVCPPIIVLRPRQSLHVGPQKHQ